MQKSSSFPHLVSGVYSKVMIYSILYNLSIKISEDG